MRIMLGIFLVFGCVLGGFVAMGGHLTVLWQPFEIVIIVGAAIGAFVIANTGSLLKETLYEVKDVAFGKRASKEDYVELIRLLSAVSRKTKSAGAQTMEKDIDDPHASPLFQEYPGVLARPLSLGFLCDYIRLMSVGQEDAHTIEALMDEEMATASRELSEVQKAVSQMAEGLPALGIVAAVLGVVKAMAAISQPPEVLGGLIAGALIGTLLGVLLSYGLVGPIALALKKRKEEEMNRLACIKAGLLAHLKGCPPQVCAEFARKVLSREIRPSFTEIEEANRPGGPREIREAA